MKIAHRVVFKVCRIILTRLNYPAIFGMFMMIYFDCAK